MFKAMAFPCEFCNATTTEQWKAIRKCRGLSSHLSGVGFSLQSSKIKKNPGGSETKPDPNFMQRLKKNE